MKFAETFPKQNNSLQEGQVMIISILAFGAIMLGVTILAGFLTTYQIRTSANVVDSAKAIYAADTGIDWGIYQFTRSTSTDPAPVMSNGASYVTTCYDASSAVVDCRNASTTVIKASGQSEALYRFLQLNL